MPLCEVIESSAGIDENCFSSGVATADAIVSGEAPGSCADTWIVGKSTFGKSATGNKRNAAAPKTRMPTITSVVMTGRRTKISETLIAFLVTQPRSERQRDQEKLHGERGENAGRTR